MKKQRITTIVTILRWSAFFVAVLFVVIEIMPSAVGQRDQPENVVRSVAHGWRDVDGHG